MTDILTRLEMALHEASVYGIGATSQFNQNILLEAAKSYASVLRNPVQTVSSYPEYDWRKDPMKNGGNGY